MKISELKNGDLFGFASRICVIKNHRQIESLTDGWFGTVDQYGNEECFMIKMPKTPHELLRFIRDYQVKYDDRLQV